MNENFDDKLDRAARELRQEIAPERDLWPGIEKVVGEAIAPRRSRWTPILAQAAAVVLLVGASSTITWMVVRDDNAPVVSVAPELMFEQASFGGNDNLGPDFVQARNGLRAALDAELMRLSPEVRNDVRANIDVVQEAIDEINVALEKEPDNVLLQQKLLSAYRDELNLLRNVSSITRNVMTRNDI